MSQADDLQRRAEKFADDVIRFIEALPKTPIAQRIANQLQDCSTSTAANYRAARRGRSRAEFTAKIGLVAEEADEAVFWLQRLVNANIATTIAISPLLDEATQLAKIFGASHRTARRRRSVGQAVREERSTDSARLRSPDDVQDERRK